MNTTLVLSVYNKIDLTKKCYNRIRELYPTAPLVISSGGSSDETKVWGNNLNDEYTTFIHDDNRITFSETYNRGVDCVKTEKLVLIHNDMVIGRYFLENIEKLLTEDTILSYTTIEPPIFAGHSRPGKVLLNMGNDFDDFNYQLFDKYVEEHKDDCKIYDGAVFFMSMYKKVFDDVGGFDGSMFIPAFCEDDDFLLRAKIKGYKLKTTECVISYHFVSMTSRFGEDMRDNSQKFELNSNKNFVRKWGIPTHIMHSMGYLIKDDLQYVRKTMCLVINDITLYTNYIFHLEPLFDKIKTSIDPKSFIDLESPLTNFDIKSKFESTDGCDIVVHINNQITNEDFDNIQRLRIIHSLYEKGKYKVGTLEVEIN
jgi:GT2 family glycosyltransferase